MTCVRTYTHPCPPPFYPPTESVPTTHPGTEATGSKQDLGLTPAGLYTGTMTFFEKQVGSAVCLSKSQKVPTLWPSSIVSGVLPKKTMKKSGKDFLGTKIYVTS